MLKTTTSTKRKEAPLVCSEIECINDHDNDCLICEACKRPVHYRCTRLPAYQIASIITKRNAKYFCQKCIIIPQELLELIPERIKSNPSIKLTNEIERLRREVSGCENLIKKQQVDETELKRIIGEKNSELLELKRKLQADPALHTVEYLEEKFEKKLDCMKDSILKTIQD